jgi:tRNA-dihydrouridine synthase B
VFDDFQIIAAPMAGITDRPFRRILRRLNPTMPIMTEMISCHSITGRGCGRGCDRYDGENTGAQIFGADPALMAEAAKILEGRGAAWIDLNMGCPVPKVATRAGAGAFLMRDHALAGRIVEAVATAVRIPVSVKTRLGWDDAHLDAADLLRVAAKSGAAWATVHARTRAQGYSGKSRWNEAADIKVSAAGFSIIFNGDIRTPADVESVRKLGAAGAMIGRAMMGNPWFFSKKENVREIILDHFDLAIEYYGKSGAPLFRKHAAWYADGMPGAARFRQLVNAISDAGEMRRTIEGFF